MIKTIEFNEKKYPAFQAEGNAAQYIMPFAEKFCKGVGYDIGCNRMEWKLPNSYDSDDRFVFPVDPEINEYHAMHLPFGEYGLVDFIFSSHCLEHVKEPWFDVLEYWKSNIREEGVMLLYLPDYSQEYWRPWNNRKHVHAFTPKLLYDAFIALGLKNVFVSGVDLMNSFAIIGEVRHA